MGYSMKLLLRTFLFGSLVLTIFFCADAQSQVKWFPGHYIDAGIDQYDTGTTAMNTLKGANGYLFQGIFTYVTWHEIETTSGTFHWNKIDNLLDALPAGKKLAVSLSWQAWTSGVQACPDDMKDNPEYDQGQRSRNGKYFSTIHMTTTMNRYLAFAEAFAKRYDSDPRLAFVTSAEIPYNDVLKVGLYNESTARANIFRLVSEMIGYFKNTPCGILGAWWSFGGGATQMENFTQAVLGAKGGFGFPDLVCKTCSEYNSQFRPYVTANAGRWYSWMGVEWKDYLPFDYGVTFPNDQIASANASKTNFIWWLTANRTAEGGKGFNDVVNYLKNYPDAGITKEYPYPTTNLILVDQNEFQIRNKSPQLIQNNGVLWVTKINSSTIASVSVYDTQGRLLAYRTNTSSIDISELRSGLYVLHIIFNSGNHAAKKFFK